MISALQAFVSATRLVPQSSMSDQVLPRFTRTFGTIRVDGAATANHRQPTDGHRRKAGISPRCSPFRRLAIFSAS